MKVQADASGGLNGLDRMVSILEALQTDGDATPAALARATGLSEPTVHRYLSALRHHGLVIRVRGSGTYSLGVKLFELGHSALRNQKPAVVARPHLEALRDLFGETVVFAEHTGNRLLVIAGAEGLHGVAKGAKVGEPDYWHSTSLGKSILAELPGDEARSILEQTELTRFTSRTMTEVGEILDSLRRVSTAGFAIDDEESEIGLRCVGSVVHDVHGAPRFAISLSGPTYRVHLDAVPAIAAATREAAAAIAHDLGWLGLSS